MSEPTVSAEELARQALQHLNSLQAAGIDWLPFAPPPAVPAVVAELSPAPAAAESPVVLGGDLFVPSLAEELPLEKRKLELEVLREQVAGCTRCTELAVARTQTVFGDGPLDPEICFIGEAPGRDEDRKGVPFVGEAGQLLNKIIAACGFQREEVYICNVLRCRPPNNRTPLPDEAANCREYLDRTLELVRPKYIVALGACAAQNLLGTTLSISRLRRRFHDYGGIPVLCTFHPAYLLRNPAGKRDVWEDMKMLLTKMGRPIPGK
jgi:DNA polymerase